jgi:ubiquinone/menaquinone biosynthesis C-methylase UbiE
MTTTCEEATTASAPQPHKTFVCPWWFGWALASPLRRLFTDPVRLLGAHARPGMTVLEPGCGMGFFTLPLAQLIGGMGRVVCVDLQPRMIAGMERRARRAGVAERVEAVVGTLDDPRLAPRAGTFDLAAAIYMVHEVPDQDAFLRRVATLLRPGGRLLLVEPRGHVTAPAFAATLARAEAAGLRVLPRPDGWRGHAALLERPER